MSGIDLRNKNFIESMRMFEEDRKISSDFIVNVLKEAIVKAYRNHIKAPSAEVRVEIDAKEIRAFHELTVVEDESDNFDETLDIELTEAKTINPNAKIGDVISMEINFAEIQRPSIAIVKNMLKQQTKEHDKQRVYDEYKDRLYDLIHGVIKTVEEKFILVDLKDTIGIMLKSEQIPGEVYRENQQITAVIKEVNRESKGSQVSLSRADAMFVKRLFEKEVPEISSGIVEIKAIAREVGERTKMAVYSHDEDIDPIGACIGPRGTRVQTIINEIKGEKIDIFEWNDDIGELVKNALSPAEVKACFFADETDTSLTAEEIEKKYAHRNRPLVVVVGDDQLSAAIGKKGKNAKLAVKLTERKIDIKTESDIAALGLDVEAKVEEFKVFQDKIKKAKEEEEFKALQEDAQKRNAEFNASLDDSDFIEDAIEEMAEQKEAYEEITVVDIAEDAAIEMQEETQEEVAPLQEVEEEVVVLEEAKEEKKETVKRAPKVREVKADYKSKFEDLAEVKKEEEKAAPKKRKKKTDDERRLRASDLKRDKEAAFEVEYSEEELEEIEAMQDEEESNSWINDDIDFDEYDDYYDKD